LTQDALIEENQRIHGLILGGWRNVPLYGQMSKEYFDLGFSRKELIARTHAVESDKTHYPVHIGTFGVNRVVMEAQVLADLIEKFRLFWFLT